MYHTYVIIHGWYSILILLFKVTSEFNLGPLHLMDLLTEKIYGLKNREFVYKKKANGKLVSHHSSLRNVKEGAAIDTHQKLQVDHSHLTVDLGKQIE